MLKVKLLYRGEETNLWDFAGLCTPDRHEDSISLNYSEKAIFDVTRRGKLSALIEVLTDCEFFLGQIFEDLDLKSSIRRFFKLKILGTFEQMRTDMELRYPQAETIFLRTNDHKRIHCYWIPGRVLEAQEGHL